MIDFNKIPIKRYSPQELDDLTVGLIKSVPDSIPIDVDLIVEKKGLELIPRPGLKRLSSTDGFYSPHKNQISYDPDVYAPRIRFSIAHELGHHILHKDLISELKLGDIEEWMEFIKSVPPWFWGKVESQANQFAGKLLVPTSMLIDATKEHSKHIATAQKMLGTDDQSIIQFLAIPLSKKFEVSEDVITNRFLNERLNPFEIIKMPK